jgi:SAM-dependent methyltransferase
VTDVRNPWLEIPLIDYERHMALPEIGQARMLSGQLKLAVEANKPQSLALIGCAGGNGLETIIGGSVRRIVGIDINAQYIEIIHSRFCNFFEQLEVYIGNIENIRYEIAPVELIFSGLIFEYVEVVSAINTMKNICLPNGRLFILLQNPDATVRPVSPSPYTSLKALASFMQLKKTGDVISASQNAGFTLLASNQITLASGKQFSILTFKC